MTAKAIEAVNENGMSLRPADERGHVDMGWLRSAHTFSFGHYFDPAHVQFESLRVINDDYIEGGQGFPEHPHRNAEIFSYVLEGAISHKDSMGNGSTVSAGGIQYMSAGSGVRHSEFNPSQKDPMRLLQIWLLPNVEDATPRYDTLDLTPEDKDGKLKLFLSKDGRDGAMHIRADADIYAATLRGDQVIDFEVRPGNRVWIQIAKGHLQVNGHELRNGDGLAVSSEGLLTITKGKDAEFILFDLGVN